MVCWVKTQAVLEAGKEVGLEVNTEKTGLLLFCHHLILGQSHDVKIANKSSENVSDFKYLGTTVTNQNYFHGKLRVG